MRKEDTISFIVYLVMIVFAVVIGFTVLMPLMNNLAKESLIPFNNAFLFAIVVVLAAIVFNAILFEVGHLLGAKLGGYKIAMFNIFGFAFYRKKGKMRFGFKNFDGLTGETKLIPKSDKSNPKPYLWFPILFFALEILAVVLVCFFVNGIKDTDAKRSVLWLLSSSTIFAAVGSMIIIYDYIPARLDSMTDGYRLTLLNKPINKIAFNKMLEIEYADFNGNKAKNITVFDEITDFTASINMMKVYEYLDSENYKEALELLNKIIADPKLVNADTYNSAVAQILSIKLLTEDPNLVSEYYKSINSYVRKYLTSSYTMEAVRAYLLISALIENSKNETKFAMERKTKAMKRTIDGRKQIEEKLYNLSIERIKSINPKMLEEDETSEPNDQN
jgi:hypothetical protein